RLDMRSAHDEHAVHAMVTRHAKDAAGQPIVAKVRRAKRHVFEVSRQRDEVWRVLIMRARVDLFFANDALDKSPAGEWVDILHQARRDIVRQLLGFCPSLDNALLLPAFDVQINLPEVAKGEG